MEETLNSERLKDEVFYRFGQQGESRLVHLLRLEAKPEHQVAICMVGDCDTVSSDRRIVVTEFSASGEKDLVEFPFSGDGLTDAIRYHFGIQVEDSEQSYLARLLNLESGDTSLVDDKGTRVECDITAFVELELKDRFDIDVPSAKIWDRSNEMAIVDLSLTYDDGSDNYESFSPSDEHIQLRLVEFCAAEDGSENGRITRLTLRIYPCDPSLLSTISEDDIDDDFKRLHSCASRFLDEVMSVEFSIRSADNLIEGISSGSDVFGITSSGSSGSVIEDDDDDEDWDDDED